MADEIEAAVKATNRIALLEGKFKAQQEYIDKLKSDLQIAVEGLITIKGALLELKGGLKFEDTVDKQPK